jgi:hypothetical protein
VVIVKSRHGRLRERIDGCHYLRFDFFAQEQANFCVKNKVMSSFLLVNLFFTRVDRGIVWVVCVIPRRPTVAYVYSSSVFHSTYRSARSTQYLM